jgi:hypothetical protein
MRVVVFGAALLLAAPAFAAPHCDGKYDAAAAMVDAAAAKYGTLYSGGSHWHQLDGIGATLDLLRLWRGRADAGFRAAALPRDVDMPLFGDGAARERVAQALDMVEGEAADLPVEARAHTALVLDLATAVDDRPDWWRAADGAATPTGVRAELAQLAATRPALDWLQTVVAASDAPWSLAWHLPDVKGDRSDGFERLLTDAQGKYQAGQGIEWAVAAQSLWHPGTSREDDLRRVAGEWEERVRGCEATPAEYAAFAVGALTSARFTGLADSPERMALLPAAVRTRVARNAAMAVVMQGPPGEVAAKLTAATPADADAEFLRWQDVIRTYAAASVEELIAIHRGTSPDAKSLRALNVLPAASLQRLALSGAFSGHREISLLRAAFVRQLALGRTQDAGRLLAVLRGKQAAAPFPQVIAPLEPAMPPDVALALAAARMPDLTALVDGSSSYAFEADVGISLYEHRGHIEVPVEFADGAALQGDLETWLSLPQKWYRFHGMHGLSWPALERQYTRKRYADPQGAMPAPQVFGASVAESYGIAKLANFDELARLRGEQRVVRQISLKLLTWADGDSSNWLKQWLHHPDLTAEALYRVVVLNRHEDGGALNGVPLAKRAYKLLHQRFPHSEWARKAKYWWKADGEKA